MKGGFNIKAKKSQFQKADEEAAKVYEDFVESFKSEEAPMSRGGGPPVKAFLRGGIVQPGQSDTGGSGSTAKKSQKYVPSFLPPSMTGAKKPSIFDDDDEDEESVFQLPKKVEKEKTRNIDTMLERLKKEQEARDDRAKQGLPPEDNFDPEHNPNMYDDGNPYTTNLYGDIGSVKVMWPRDEEQRRKGRNCGFVAFMTREGADKALTALSGLLLHDYELQLGWGKAVPLPDGPIYRRPPDGAAEPVDPKGGVPAGAHGSTHITSTRSEGRAFAPAHVAVAGAAPGAAPSTVTASFAMPWGTGEETADHIIGTVHQGVGPQIEVQIPESRVRYIVDTLALYILKDGCEFEQIVMEQEQNNPDYSFLFDLKSPVHAYYRWRLYSLAEGDSMRSWRSGPFVMGEGGQQWVERNDIVDAMMFTIDNADAAGEVVEILSEALTLPETPVPTKIARLFLVSDILHNSTAPVRNASRYRSRLEAVLPTIFESLQDTYRSVETRMTQEFLRRYVLRVLRVWRERFIFTDDFLNGLQASFLSPVMASAVAALHPTEGGSDPEPDAESIPKECMFLCDFLNGLQASFLSPVMASAVAALHPTEGGSDPEPDAGLASIGRPDIRSELQELSPDEVERRCRLTGLSVKEGTQAMITRLLALDMYLNPMGSGDEGGEEPSSLMHSASQDVPASAAGSASLEAGPQAGSGAGAEEAEMGPIGPAPPPVPPPKPILPMSRWTTIDEEEEKQALPTKPISKWLEDQQREQAEMVIRQASEAAAAAAADRIFDDTDEDDPKDGSPDSTPPLQPSFGGRWGGAGGEGGGGTNRRDSAGGVDVAAAAAAAAGSVVDETRRRQLREIELSCAR
eukprot:gene32267-16833_t